LSTPENQHFDPQSIAHSDSSPATSFSATDGSQTNAPPSPVAVPPVENPVWNWWDLLVVLSLSIVTWLVSQLAILLGAHFLLYPRLPIIDLAQRPILALASMFVTEVAIAALIFLWVEGKYRVRLWQAIKWNWPAGIWRWVALGVAMLFVLNILGNLLPMPKDTPFEKLFSRPRDAYLVAIFAITLGPFVEELFFRGFFYPVVARRCGAAWGIFLTALPFALLHLPQYGDAWAAFLVIFVVGIVCGAVRAVTKSVGASFLVHVGYNGTQMVLAVLLTRGFTHMPKSLFFFRLLD
jgi:uncharacterized protein